MSQVCRIGTRRGESWDKNPFVLGEEGLGRAEDGRVGPCRQMQKRVGQGSGKARWKSPWGGISARQVGG